MNRRSKLGKPTKEFIIKRQGFWRHIGSRKETTELLSLTEKKRRPSMLKDAVSTGLKANDSLSIALFGYDIHELLLHDDDAANRKVTHKLLDVRIAECGSADFILTGQQKP